MDQDPDHDHVQSTVHTTVHHVTVLDFHPSLLDQDPDHDQVQTVQTTMLLNLNFIPALLDQDPDHDRL